MLWIWLLRLYFQHFIFFTTHEWAQKARVLHYAKAERLSRDKHFILFSPFVNYDENELLWIWYLRLYSKHFTFFVTHKWAQKARLLHYTRPERLAMDKHSSLFSPFVRYDKNEYLWILLLRLYYQHFIFSVTYKWAQKARVLHNTKPERLAKDNHSNLFSPFVSYDENELLWLWYLRLYSQHFILFVTHTWAQKARVLHYAKAERLTRDKHSSLFSPFVSYDEN